MDAGETGDTGTAEKVSQHRFGLIVGGVSGGDTAGVAASGDLRKKLVTRAASSVFEIGFLVARFGSNICAGDMKGEIVKRGELGDEFLVGIGSAAAQTVIEVGDGEHQAALFADFEEKSEKGHRVGASGDGDSHAIAGAKTSRVRLIP